MLTGILSEGDEEADVAQEWTIEELKAAKPLMVYRYIDNLMDASDENYKFSQSFEVKILAKEKVIEQINAKWMCKRSPIDIEADRKDKKNQSSIVFYAFTGQKMGELGLKSRMSSRNFLTTLSKFEKKNKLLCGKEIKRLEKIAKDEETASK